MTQVVRTVDYEEFVLNILIIYGFLKHTLSFPFLKTKSPLEKGVKLPNLALYNWQIKWDLVGIVAVKGNGGYKVRSRKLRPGNDSGCCLRNILFFGSINAVSLSRK